MFNVRRFMFTLPSFVLNLVILTKHLIVITCSFSIPHFGIGKVKGKFPQLSAEHLLHSVRLNLSLSAKSRLGQIYTLI